MFIAIIDYNMGNISSVSSALKKVGADVRVTNDVRVINDAEALILPGVGGYRDAYRNLEKLKLIEVLKKNISKKFFLGICLGLQLLFEYSMENGRNEGLGIFKGSVEKIPSLVKVPHMGWNQLKILNKKSRILNGIREGENFYFVHSYYVKPGNKDIINSVTYYGVDITAGIEKDNIYGIQFHPEKSSSWGLKLLENFWNIVIEGRL
jgi:glutamine amidotransferase